MELNILMPILSEAVNWNKARINFLAQFLVALVKVRTVNFAEIATAFSGKAKTESKYKRIVRFFRSFTIDFTAMSKLIVALLPMKNLNWVLTMDRTNWKIGKININILMLGIAYKGIAFPIFWMLLPKRGNSNTSERKQLINRFLNVFSLSKIRCLVADREFIGTDWFSYLVDKSILFRIRIKENMLVTNARGIEVAVKNLFCHLQIGQSLILHRRTVCGLQLHVIGLKAPLKNNFTF